MSLTAPPPPPPPAPPPPMPPVPPSTSTTYEPPPAQPSRSGARLALRIGAVITGLLIIVAALNLFSLTAGRSSSNIHRPFALSGTTLSIRAGSADVSLVPGGVNGIEVDRTARVPHGQTMKEPSLSGDVLSLPADCSSRHLGWLWFCSVHYTIHVPAGLQLDVHADSGDLEATGIQASSLGLHAGSGDIDVERVTSASVTADTGSGDVSGRRVSAGRVTVKTGSGDVDLSFGQDPATVLARTGSGDMTLAVPQDTAEYFVHGQTGSGDYSNRIRSIGEAPAAGTPVHSIDAETGSGDLTIRYAG
jgi:putative adhesin